MDTFDASAALRNGERAWFRTGKLVMAARRQRGKNEVNRWWWPEELPLWKTKRKESTRLDSPSPRCRNSRGSDPLVPVRRNGGPHPLGKRLDCARNQGPNPVAFRCSNDSVHSFRGCPAHFADCALGRILSLAVSSFVGVLLLLLGQCFFDSRLWRRCSSVSLARCGADRKY